MTQQDTGFVHHWNTERFFGFIVSDRDRQKYFFHISSVRNEAKIETGCRANFIASRNTRGPVALDVQIFENQVSYFERKEKDGMVEEIEELDAATVDKDLLAEVSGWKREAKSENSLRYFWHVKEVDQIEQGAKYFVIGRKGSGKTAICEHFYKLSNHDVFAAKLTFKQFPFNELYNHQNESYTKPNQYITIWKYLIYSTVCELMLKNEMINGEIREKLDNAFGGNMPLTRRVKKWVGKEFGISLFGLSIKLSSRYNAPPESWISYVDFLEDFLCEYAGTAKYYILFDELDEDYRDIINADQHNQYTALITSLFKAVQDVRTIFDQIEGSKIYPVVFLRDDIYEIVQDSDKNKWGDFKVDLSWDYEKVKQLIAFRISRALDSDCENVLSFDDAWSRLFGQKLIGVGTSGRRKISTFEYIARSTLLRPRDFVVYLQNCAQHAIDYDANYLISPQTLKTVDKAFSNYLREELTDELFAILPDIARIFDAISQLRKWNFSVEEIEREYLNQVKRGIMKEKNVKFVLQVLYMFDVIGNITKTQRPVFRYQNREARLNFNERLIVHRGLFKSLQIE